ncbi:MAG TPA: ATP-binding protein [Opitutaceae bacterium]|jgi:nitrogen fixation/metabolism regulation signal transduction histidine kinase|nr:ATP-binding protein [Opitutaceae bacterium]
MPKRPHRLPHDQAVFLYALAAGAPAVALALFLLWRSPHDPVLQWTLTLGLLVCWLACAAAARQRVVRPLQTMSNLLLALREGDYSFRAFGARYGDPLGDVLAEINTLGSLLQTQRRGAMEATALLRTVMSEMIDVAIFAFDGDRRLRLVNRAGEKLLAERAPRLLGRTAEALGLAECLEGEPSRMLATREFPGAAGRWGLRRTSFREEGRPHQLVVIADLSQPLREEELKAWQRLVRVLGHELNNSLAPIKSIAGSLGSALRRQPRAADWEADLEAGLDIIASRAESLARFLQAYSRLARLPQPSFASCDLPALLRRVAALETRVPIALREGPALTARCDPAQIEQALINLLKNAAEAALEQRASGKPEAGVRLGWGVQAGGAEIWIEDDGPGVAQTGNLFVPFFTTKPEGSGIGLVLCRQIAENHGGSLELVNRPDGAGCVAHLRLSLAGASPA